MGRQNADDEMHSCRGVGNGEMFPPQLTMGSRGAS